MDTTSLTLRLALKPRDFVLCCTVCNSGTRDLVVGGLNEWNFRVKHASRNDVVVQRWFTCLSGPLNAYGVYSLRPGESISSDLLLLEDLEFPVAGCYTAGVLYDSMGYRERFAGAPEPQFRLLDTLDPFRVVSNLISFEVTDAALVRNHEVVAERRRHFLSRVSSADFRPR